MSAWQIKAYWLPGGTCPIRDWYRVQNVSVQAEFDATLVTLRAAVDWTDTKAFKALKRNHTGLGEIRFKLEKPRVRRFRPVGIWPPVVDHEFILLLGCEKVGHGVLIPPNAFTLALTYKTLWQNGQGEINDYV
jgi:hypothetical protein